MFTISPSQERLTARSSAQDSIEFLIENAVSSLAPPQQERRNLIKVQLMWKGSTQLVSNLQVGYQDLDVLQIVSDYISKLKREIHPPEFKENTQSIPNPDILTKPNLGSIPIKNSSAKLPSQELQITQDRLIELLQEEEEDEYGILKPTPYAFDKAWNLTLAASQFMGISFKRASVSTDAEGGIRLTWTKQLPEAEVRLICPAEPNKQLYLYHEKDSQYDVVKDVSGFTLASWLQWLNQV
jgi:hypothetical protein